MNWENNLYKNQIKKLKKKTENQSLNAACEQKSTSEKWKFGSYKKLGLEWTTNGLGKPFRIKSDPKNRKNPVKIKVKLPNVNKKPLARMRFFVQTPFSHST